MHTPQRAQGIHCGGLRVALPYSWARHVVDAFELSLVPNAPPWLVGAANVDGRIVAVVDLAAWADPGAAAAPGKQARLLVGGDAAEAFALRFEGLPALLRHGADDTASAHGLPPALQRYVSADAVADASDTPWPVLNMPLLAKTWADELAHRTGDIAP